MSTEKVKEVLFKALERATQKPVDPALLKPETDLRDGLGVDSLSLIEMVWEVEEAFGISIDESVLKNLKTVGDVISAVEGLIAKQGQGAAA